MKQKRDILRAGLIGFGIQRSLTPAMHMREGEAQGVDYRYELIDLNERKLGPDDLETLVVEAEEQGFCGLNITYPCKQRILPLLTDISEDARKLGAVNTVILRDGKRIGHNTDWWGFAQGLSRQLPDADLSSVIQIGAGGAGAATAYAVLEMGARSLAIFDIDPDKASELASLMGMHFPEASVSVASDLQAFIGHATGLVHATPIGMDKHPGMPLSAELLHPGLWVAEVVYFPLETALLQAARQRGCRVANGGGMAVFQAVGAFSLFTGLEPDVGRMLRHFEALTEAGVTRQPQTA
ncbi:shikimate dehydrogenase [Rhizobium rosettiformans]|uniref:Shikimate dehydrogenase n=1 Tax=Rhizobium rosettiformans TaxID=1368430 RepID=A0ABX7ESL5_9HYPH|nr:shikimate dehydrogenase [Rhizobium rosettiformans]QRF51327.1 shikimate dehydrogenase [Rhizobium rosettiformans]